MAGFQILNDPSSGNNAATYVEQARPDSGDFTVLAAGQAGNGVVTGCGVTVSGSGLSIGGVVLSQAVLRTTALPTYSDALQTIFTIPTTAQTGDLLLVGYGEFNEGGGTFTLPSGWTTVAIEQDNNGTACVSFCVASRICQANDPGSSVTFAWGNNWSDLASVMAVYESSGVDVSATASVEIVSGSNNGSGSITTPSVMTTNPLERVLSFVLAGSYDDNPTVATSSSVALVIQNNGSNPIYNNFGLYDVSQPAAGASTGAVFNVTNTTTVVAITVAIKPIITSPVNTLLVGGALVALSPGLLTPAAADSSHDRVDLVVASTAGTPSIITGTPAAVPAWPTIPTGDIVLAAVTVPSSATALVNANIIDKRVFLIAPSAGNVPAVYASAPSAATTGFYFDTALSRLGISDGSYWHYYTETSNTVPVLGGYTPAGGSPAGYAGTGQAIGPITVTQGSGSTQTLTGTPVSGKSFDETWTKPLGSWSSVTVGAIINSGNPAVGLAFPQSSDGGVGTAFEVFAVNNTSGSTYYDSIIYDPLGAFDERWGGNGSAPANATTFWLRVTQPGYCYFSTDNSTYTYVESGLNGRSGYAGLWIGGDHTNSGTPFSVTITELTIV
jgi:hypothetical protein